MHAFSGERWWPALISVAAVVALVAGALRLVARRDIGSGIVAARAGPARAERRLQGSLGLAWRQQRASVAGWAAALFLTGIGYGAIGDDVKDLLGDSQFSHDVFEQGGGSLVNSFYAVAAVILALIAAGFAIASVLRSRAEKDGGRVESLLATGLSRQRWGLTNLVVTVSGTVVVVGAAGLGLGLGYRMVTGDGSAVGRLLGATLPYSAPVLVLVALTWLAYGLSARWAGVGWLALTFCVVVLVFGELLQLPRWLVGLSPFTHLALVPAESFAWELVLWQLALAAVLGTAGIVALRRRDLR